jgi:hypothetical protein
MKESAKSGTKVFVCVARLPQSYENGLYQKLWMWVYYFFIALEINNVLCRNVCILYRNVYVLYLQHIYIYSTGLFLY